MVPGSLSRYSNEARDETDMLKLSGTRGPKMLSVDHWLWVVVVVLRVNMRSLPV